MGAYERMKKALAATGLYKLDGTTAVDRELQAYAEGLDRARQALEELQAESFVATSAGYGLSLREEAFRAAAPAAGTEQRRAALLGLGAAGPGAFAKQALEKTLAAAGLSVEIVENPPAGPLTVRFLEEPACGRERAQKILEKFMPAHLSYSADYGGVS